MRIRISKVKIAFEPRDIWIGIYWNYIEPDFAVIDLDNLYIYICIIPMLPICIAAYTGEGEPRSIFDE